jgi:uncharacterized repeat protein (TIGR02543 family)
MNNRPTKMGQDFGLFACAVVAIALATLLTVSASSAQCVPPPSGLISWWPGESTANDIVGTNNGTLQNGATFTTGRVGQAFSFDGVDDYFQAPTEGLPTGNSNRTLELWVNSDAFSSNDVWAGYGIFGNPTQTYHLGAVNGRLFFSQWGGALWGPLLQTGRWYHVAVTNISNSVTLYLDGVAVGTGTLTINTPAGTTFCIGKIPSSPSGTYRLHGKVDEVSIYNRALSASEILAIYMAGSEGKCKTYTLTLNAVNGTITKNPDQLQYSSGSTVELTAIPFVGYHFVNWTGDAAGSTNPITVTMDADKSITAHFAINTYIITATAGDHGTISPSGDVSVVHGSSQTFTITAEAGYHVADVLVDGSTVGALESYTFDNVTATHTISATFSPNRGTISGTVTRTGGIGIPTVIVKLLDNEGNLISDQETNSSGNYCFADLPWGNYKVMVVEPLGYETDANPKLVALASTSVQVDFTLTQMVLTNRAEKRSYWKHQFDVHVRGHGRCHETAAQLQNYIDLVQAHYTPHFNVFASTLTFGDWQDALSRDRDIPPYIDKALQELAALVLNLVSLKLGQYTVVTEDGRTAGEVLTYVSELFTDPDVTRRDYVKVKELAKKVNEGKRIRAGEVPPSSILYKQGAISWGFETPDEFALSQNYPNPFNPTTEIRYQISEAGHVRLKVYNLLGQEVATLVDEVQEAGYHRLVFDASALASGAYFYRIVADRFVNVKRMMILK